MSRNSFPQPHPKGIPAIKRQKGVGERPFPPAEETLVIREIDETNVGNVNSCNGAFIVDSKLCLHAENGLISYSITKVPEYEKRYPVEEVDYSTFIRNPDQTIFLAYVLGQIAGQIILRKNWNRYGYIESLEVDAKFRTQGVGKRLMERAVEWAKALNLPGIALETQNTNVGACRFYESCGFRLGGFDHFLYQGRHPDSEETALYWYLIF